MTKKKTKQVPDLSESSGLPRKRVLAVFLLVAVALAYLSALQGGYIWDDPEYVLNNPTLRTAAGLKSIWFEPGATPQYYPMVFTTFWVEYHCWGLNPMGYHLVNILLHGICAVLLWRLLCRLGVPGAFACAAIFALHPIQVESVAWITERKNVLSLLFYLLAFRAYGRLALPGLLDDPERRVPPGRLYALALGFFLLALLSKTVTATFPAAMALVLWWKKERCSLRDFGLLLPFLALGLAFGLVTVWMEKFHVGATGDAWSLSTLEKILLAGRIPWFYAAKILFPAGLIFIYPRWTIDGSMVWQYAFPAALAAVVVLLFLFRSRLGKGPLVAVLFFVGSLTPALGFFNVYPMRFSFVADHFQYLAGLGFIALGVASVTVLLRRLGRRWKVLGPLLLASSLLICGALTYQQGKRYKNQETLWRDTLAKNPGAWIAHSNLAEILFDSGRVDEAMKHCEEALVLKPDLPEAHGNLANALFGKGRYEDAVTHFEVVLSLDPGNVTALSNLGATLEKLGQLERAAERLEEAVRGSPNFWKAHFNLANVRVKLTLNRAAIEAYNRVIALNPGFLEARYRLGVVLQAEGERQAAAEQFRQALQQARLAGRGDLVGELEIRLRQCD